MTFLNGSSTGNNAPTSPFLLNTSTLADHSEESQKLQDNLDEEALLAEFQKNPKAAMALAESYLQAAQAPRQPMTEITPVPGFVLQTVTTKASSQVLIGQKTVAFPKDTAVFINICSSAQLPKPTFATEAEIQKAINAEEGATYQVPLQLSPPREYKDSLAKSYLVVDACIHTEPYKRTEKDFDYKLYIMELAMEWVEEKCKVELSRNFQLPNMKSKDELKKRSVILPKPPAIQEVDTHTSVTQDKPQTMMTPVATKSTKQSSTQEKNPEASTQNQIRVPTMGKEDIQLKNRILPCPKGTLGIIVEVDLPNH
ncbi:hypothetical protein BGZ94_005891, partial [Podila epigama]